MEMEYGKCKNGNKRDKRLSKLKEESNINYI